MPDFCSQIKPNDISRHEQEVVGAMMRYPDCVPKVVSILSASDFGNGDYGQIFRAIAELVDQGIDPRPEIVAKHDKLIPPVDILNAFNSATCLSAEIFAGEIKAASKRREFRLLLEAAAREAEVPGFDPGAIAGEMQARLAMLSEGRDQASGTGYKFQPLDSADFLAADYRVSWLVKRLLVQGQPAVIGGASKSLKTSLAADLAISLGTGEPFLGQFEVYRPIRTAIISGESGQATLQETARRIMHAKGLSPEHLAGRFSWGFQLPNLSRPSDLAELSRGLKKQEFGVVLIDPLYLCLLSGQSDLNAANLYEIGPLLLNVAKACLDAGATPIIIHHVRKNIAPGTEITLEHLAFAGVVEFVRQWILVGRREAYEPGSGIHRLTMSVGGSAGQSGSWGLDIDEGHLGDDFAGRKWEIIVTEASELRAAKAEAKTAKTEAADRDRENKVLTTLDELADADGVATVNKVRDRAKLNGPQMSKAISGLVSAGLLDEFETVCRSGKSGSSKQPAKAIRRAKINTKTDCSDWSERLVGQ